jgi:hypothetical protein
MQKELSQEMQLKKKIREMILLMDLIRLEEKENGLNPGPHQEWDGS